MSWPAQHYVNFNVSFNFNVSNNTYQMWAFTKLQLLHILSNSKVLVTWERRSDSRPAKSREAYHPTARARSEPAAPLLRYLKEFSTRKKGRVLYHGVGRDDAGAELLGAVRYDPYHPDPKVRRFPRGQFAEVHSHYTLNVLSKREGLSVLQEIYDLLTPQGVAVISVGRFGALGCY